ncbi:MAG: hypothetical protein RMY34_25430 [Aulosira sp. DedQUE10]|nr:hypothetical protein [Aulosira sp. DedQUE10]
MVSTESVLVYQDKDCYWGAIAFIVTLHQQTSTAIGYITFDTQL